MSWLKLDLEFSRVIRTAVLVSCAVFSPLSKADEAIEAIRKAANEQLDIASTELIFKKADLAKKYVTALDGLEKTLTTTGKLDQIVHLREEREMVQKNGDTTAYADKELAELRDKYNKGLEALDATLVPVRAKISADIALKARAAEIELTRAGKIDDAVALRNEAQKLLLEYGGPASSTTPQPSKDDSKDDSKVAGSTVLKPLEAIKIPQDTPPAFDDPFSIPDRWLESLTVPAVRQKVRKLVMIGDRAKKKWPLVAVPPGSRWISEDQGRVELSAGKFVTSGARFEKLKLEGDLDCWFYFLNSSFDDCYFGRGGVWYGWDMGSKFYFENCLIKSKFSGPLSVGGVGIRAQSSVFSNIDFPGMSFGKKQPADYLNAQWLRIVNCRFVKCSIPLSFLLLTRDCIFEDCTFLDDPPMKEESAEFTMPIEVVLYVRSCKSKMTKHPAAVTLTEKPDNALRGVTIPTVSSLESQLPR